MDPVEGNMSLDPSSGVDPSPDSKTDADSQSSRSEPEVDSEDVSDPESEENILHYLKGLNRKRVDRNHANQPKGCILSPGEVTSPSSIRGFPLTIGRTRTGATSDAEVIIRGLRHLELDRY